jgi:hypothetical protein
MAPELKRSGDFLVSLSLGGNSHSGSPIKTNPDGSYKWRYLRRTTLDAIHLATAEALGDPPALVTIITRDGRVGDNATALGHPVE